MCISDRGCCVLVTEKLLLQLLHSGCIAHKEQIPVSYTHLTIYHKANDMDRLIDELTFYSKIDTNKIPYTFSRINVANYFRDCIDEVGLELEARGVELGYFNYVDEDEMCIRDRLRVYHQRVKKTSISWNS